MAQFEEHSGVAQMLGFIFRILRNYDLVELIIESSSQNSFNLFLKVSYVKIFAFKSGLQHHF
jgi:hypothetical protein